MSYAVRVHRSARKDIEKFPLKEQKRIHEKLVSLAEHPRPQKTIKLQALAEAYRLRVGSYRIIYEIDDEKKEVVIGRVVRRTDTTYR